MCANALNEFECRTFEEKQSFFFWWNEPDSRFSHICLCTGTRTERVPGTVWLNKRLSACHLNLIWIPFWSTSSTHTHTHHTTVLVGTHATMSVCPFLSVKLNALRLLLVHLAWILWKSISHRSHCDSHSSPSLPPSLPLRLPLSLSLPIYLSISFSRSLHLSLPPSLSPPLSLSLSPSLPTMIQAFIYGSYISFDWTTRTVWLLWPLKLEIFRSLGIHHEILLLTIELNQINLSSPFDTKSQHCAAVWPQFNCRCPYTFALRFQCSPMHRTMWPVENNEKNYSFSLAFRAPLSLYLSSSPSSTRSIDAVKHRRRFMFARTLLSPVLIAHFIDLRATIQRPVVGGRAATIYVHL